MYPMSLARACSALVLLLSAACADTADDATPTPPRAPTAADQQSSVCAAYSAQLAEAKAALAKAPRDSALVARVATYQSVIADACN